MMPTRYLSSQTANENTESEFHARFVAPGSIMTRIHTILPSRNRKTFAMSCTPVRNGQE